MTDKSREDQYIKCARCRCKYINGDEHIKNDFGYNRLNERFKTCNKCRTGRKEKSTCDKCRADITSYQMKRHQKTNSCKQWELLISRIDINDPDIKEFHYTWKDEPIPIYNDINKTNDYKNTYLIKKHTEEQWTECLIDSDDDEKVMETKSKLAMELIGPITMF